MSTRRTALALTVGAAVCVTPFAASAAATGGTSPAAAPPTGVVVICLRDAQGRAAGPGPTGRVWSDGISARSVRVDDSAEAADDRCDRARVPAGAYTVGADRLQLPRCAKAMLTSIDIRRGQFSHSTPAFLGFAFTGVAPGETTRVTMRVGCAPASPSR